VWQIAENAGVERIMVVAKLLESELRYESGV
jgi:hypothetical protein